MRSSASPVAPPCDSPRIVMTPRPRNTSPVRKGLTSTSCARATRSPPSDEQDEWNADPARAEEAVEPGVDLVAHVAPVPAEPERDGEEDADEDEREPDQLGMLLRPAPFERERFFLRTRAGDLGRKCFERFLGAMNAISSERGALLPRIF